MSFVYLSITSWTVSIASFFVAYFVFKKFRNEESTIFLSFFWLTMGALTWFFGGFAPLLWYLEKNFLSEIFAHITHIWAFFGSLPLIYFLVATFLHRKGLAKIFLIFYILCFFVFLFFLCKEGVLVPHVSEWGVKFGIGPQALLLVKVVYVPAVLFLFFGLLKSMAGLIREEKGENLYILLSVISILGYLGMLYLDAIRFFVGWPLVFERMIMVLFILMNFLVHFFRSHKKEITEHNI